MKKHLLFATLSACIALPEIASAALTAVGPADRMHGFPTFYQDATGLKLGPCLNPAHCGPLEGVRADRPIRFPTNFPLESNFFSATGDIGLATGGNIEIEMSVGAGFTTPRPRKGQNTTTNIFRIRGFDMPIGTYKITHPYGTNTFTVTRSVGRGINFTSETEAGAGDFNVALGGTIGPFLKWDPAIAPLAPAGFIGESGTPHAFTGSPVGTNFVKVEKVDGASLTEVGFTDQLDIAGKIVP